MAIEKDQTNIDQNGAIDIELWTCYKVKHPKNMGMEVQLPEEMNIQGDMTSAFEIGPDGNVIPMFESRISNRYRSSG